MPKAPVSLRCEDLRGSLCVDARRPRLSWQLVAEGSRSLQRAFQVRLERTSPAGASLLWDSGWVTSADTAAVPPCDLPPHSTFSWSVRVRDGANRTSAFSDAATFGTGFQGARWPADWVEFAPEERGKDGPAPHLRRTFSLGGRPVSARLYVTARGLVDPWLNGRRVGGDWMLPGWTDYDKRIEYTAYEVTSSLRKGPNTLGAILGHGWASGRIGFFKGRNYYAEEPCLLAALRIVHADGSVEWIGTDASWQARTLGILTNDFLDGQMHDARLDDPAWCAARASSGDGWRPVAPAKSAPTVELSGKILPPVRAIREFRAIRRTQLSNGAWILDFGQNFAGVARLRLRAPAGTRITLRFGEMLCADGSLYTENLRSARATDTYICSGEGIEVWEPRLTFHGFRYVELTGLPGKPSATTLVGIALASDIDDAGGFECSNPLLNQLQSNIRWGQLGNFLDVPTDCPQRDERLGWTGDAQAFAPTALFNFDSVAFLRKYCRDLREAQRDDGQFTDVAPDAILRFTRQQGTQPWPVGNAGWADAGVIIPWRLYEETGDVSHLSENYDAMCRWIEYQRRTSDGLVRPETTYGDWVATEAVRPNWAPTPSDLLGTAYFALTTRLTAASAKLIGRDEDAARLSKLERRIVAAFNRRFVTPDGRIAGDTQTAYAIALAFDLLPERLRPAALSNLVKAVKRRDSHLSTGFLGTPLLCPSLTAGGQHELACKLLLNEDYPSWLMPVKNGATTMWERWNSWTPDKGFGPVDMNSFNHYAFGAVGEWIYREIAGLASAAPGWRRLRFTPRVGSAALTHARAWHRTPNGPAECGWAKTRAGWRITCTVPPNAIGDCEVPGAWLARVKAPAGAAGWKLASTRASTRLARLQPGTWTLELEPAR